MTHLQPKVLFVDPKSDHAALLREAISATALPYQSRHASTGDEAITLLRDGDFIPDVVLLELGLPDMDGLNVVEFIKQSRAFRHIPVVVFTELNDPAQVERAYDAMANCVITKPANPAELATIARVVATFWLGCAVLPNRAGPAVSTALKAAGR